MQEHLFVAGQFLLVTDLVQAVIEVQAFTVVGDDLRAYFHLGIEFHFVQIIEVQFEGEQRVATGFAVVAVHAEAVHQGVGGVAENQQVEGVAQVAVVVDPVGDDCGLVGGESGHDWVPAVGGSLGSRATPSPQPSPPRGRGGKGADLR
ncbi:hypothetical protein D3C81_1589090 [compost metagenome]